MKMSSQLRNYGIALGFLLVALAFRMALTPLLHDRLPFITVFWAVAAATWYGGKGPGIFVLLSSTLAVGYFIFEPVYSLAIPRSDQRLGLLLYFLTSAGILAMVESLRNARNLAEEKQKEIQAARESFRHLADAAPVLIWMSDLDKLCTWFNRQWLEFVGRSMEQELGNGWAENVHPDDFSRCVKTYTTAFDARVPFSMEYRLRRYDGEYRWILDNGIPWYQSEGKFSGYIGSCVDITDRVAMEEALKDADRRKDDFIATLAHELRNPLAPVVYSLELMRAAPQNPDVMEQARARIARQVGHMVRIIDDLLDISRITRDRLELKKTPLDLVQLVREVIEAAQVSPDASRHQLTVALPDRAIYLHADRVRLTQVFGNLLGNARKYTPPNGKIHISVEAQGAEVKVTVGDNGLGIPREMQAKVFEMFTRINHGHESAGGGLGIGLSLVKRLIQMHGGSVKVSSQGPGQGSEFIVCLPVLTVVPPPEALANTVQRPNQLPSFRILVVDDNADSASAIVELLKLAGQETIIASDGEGAVMKAETYQPDIVLLDIGLPKLNGYEVCSAIRQFPAGKDALIIALTGWGQDHDRARSKAAGFDFHFVKPVDYEALLKLVAGFGDEKRVSERSVH